MYAHTALLKSASTAFWGSSGGLPGAREVPHTYQLDAHGGLSDRRTGCNGNCGQTVLLFGYTFRLVHVTLAKRPCPSSLYRSNLNGHGSPATRSPQRPDLNWKPYWATSRRPLWVSTLRHPAKVSLSLSLVLALLFVALSLPRAQGNPSRGDSSTTRLLLLPTQTQPSIGLRCNERHCQRPRLNREGQTDRAALELFVIRTLAHNSSSSKP
jgi:hypothetical protein